MTSFGPKLFEAAAHANAYLSFRPTYPKAVIENILTFCNKQNFLQSLVVDVGCGSGQSTRYLAPYFKRVLGVDVSENQLQNAGAATKESNVEFKTGGAESIPCKEDSVDLVTTAQAFHWFNFDLFFKEVDRVLKPGGCLALYGYGIHAARHENKEIENAINDIYLGIHKGILGKYWDDRRMYVDNCYADVNLPYEDSERDMSLEIKRELDVTGLFGYIRSFSSYRLFEKENPDKLHIFEERYRKLLETVAKLSKTDNPADFKFDFVAPIFILVGRKPTK